MRKINLTALLADGSPVNAQNWRERQSFIDDRQKVSVIQLDEQTIELKTLKGVYRLRKHPSLNYFVSVCNETRVQVTLKKMVGVVRFR